MRVIVFLNSDPYSGRIFSAPASRQAVLHFYTLNRSRTCVNHHSLRRDCLHRRRLPCNAITPTLWKYDSKEKWSKNEEFEVNRNVTLEFVVSCLFRRRIEITEIFNWQYIQKIYYSFEIFPTNYSFEIFPRNVCRLTCAWPYPSFLFNFLFEWNYFKSDGKTWYNNTNIIYLIIRLMDFAVCISVVLTSVLVNTYHFMTTQCPSRRFKPWAKFICS